MTLSPQDWRLLRTPLIALGLSLLFVGVLMSYTQKQATISEQAMRAQQSQLSQARQKYQSSGMEKETIVKYFPQYQQLIKSGLIGEEQRIEWVDSLRNIHEQQKLFAINYDIAVQEVYKPVIALNTGNFTLYRSVMKLSLAMLHEGDIFSLLQALNQQQSAQYMLRQCEFVRLSKKIEQKLTPNMQADCELDWITIHEPQFAGTVQP